MIEAPHYSSAGAKRDGVVRAPGRLFDGTVNEPVLHQAVKVFLNNQRQGTAKTKTRSFVSGGNQKPWKQKGTGRARQGSTRAPHWRGGGIVFGPIPRDYRTDIPRKVKQLARKSALNARAREGALHVVERFAFRRPKTAQLAGLLASLGLDGRKVLVLTTGANEAVYLSGRNLPTVQVHAVRRGRRPTTSSGRRRWWSRRARSPASCPSRWPMSRDGEDGDGREAEKRRQARQGREGGEGRQGREEDRGQGGQEVGHQGQGGQEEHGQGEAKKAAKKPAKKSAAKPKKKGEQVMPALHADHRPPGGDREELGRLPDAARCTPSRCTPRPTSTRSGTRSRQLFGVTVTGVRTMQMRRHAVTRGRTSRHDGALEEGRSSRSRTATRSPCSRAEMSIRQFRPMTAATRFKSVSGFDEITRDDAREVAARADQEVAAAATTRATSPRGTGRRAQAPVPRRSTSSGTSSGSRARSAIR